MRQNVKKSRDDIVRKMFTNYSGEYKRHKSQLVNPEKGIKLHFWKRKGKEKTKEKSPFFLWEKMGANRYVYLSSLQKSETEENVYYFDNYRHIYKVVFKDSGVMVEKVKKSRNNVIRKMFTDYSGEYERYNLQLVNPEKGIKLYLRKDEKKTKEKPHFYFLEKVKGKYVYLSTLRKSETEENVYYFDNYRYIYKVVFKESGVMIENFDFL